MKKNIQILACLFILMFILNSLDSSKTINSNETQLTTKQNEIQPVQNQKPLIVKKVKIDNEEPSAESNEDDFSLPPLPVSEEQEEKIRIVYVEKQMNETYDEFREKLKAKNEEFQKQMNEKTIDVTLKPLKNKVVLKESEELLPPTPNSLYSTDDSYSFNLNDKELLPLLPSEKKETEIKKDDDGLPDLTKLLD